MEFLVAGIALFLTVVFGFWLSRLGKPYNGALFNVHKLLALGAVVVAGIRVFGMLKSIEVQIITILLVILAVVCVIALFASGAMMSMEKLDYGVMRSIHRIGLVVLVLAILLSLAMSVI